jgi:Clostripain family
VKYSMRVLICCFLSISLALDAAVVTKPWTILVYLAADNNLYDPFSFNNIKQLQNIGTNDLVNILIYYCKHPHGQQKVGQRIIVYQDRLEIVQTDINADSGSEKTALDACIWACTDFPSEHVAVVFWDHGSGVLNPTKRGVCFDDTTGNYLTDINLKNILNVMSTKYLNCKKVDIVGFDACLMAGLEFFSTLSPFADYVIASEETIPGAGWDYTHSFGALAKGSVTPNQLARNCVNAYNRAYESSDTSYTLSAIKSSIMEYLAKNVDDVAKTVMTMLDQQHNSSVTMLLKKSSALKICIRFEEQDYADLRSLYTNMLKNIDTIELQDQQQTTLWKDNFRKLLTNGLLLMKRCTIAQAYSEDYALSGGISIYYPLGKIHPSYKTLDWTLRHPSWLQLLQKIYA